MYQKPINPCQYCDYPSANCQSKCQLYKQFKKLKKLRINNTKENVN